MPKPLILVPRPAPHLPRTLAALSGLPTLPLALGQPQTLPAALPAAATALLLTSPLAVPGIAASRHPGIPAYCVGPATAQAATACAIPVSFTGTSNGHAMAAAIAALGLPPQTFVHLHGDHAGTAWYPILEAAGHAILPLLAYRTRRIAALPRAVLAARPTHTLLFSAGSARHLANLYKNANIPLTGTALCLSPAVAQAAANHWPRVKVASHPTLAAMAQLARTTTT